MKKQSLKVRKEQVHQHHCQDCPALCCHDFALMIHRPYSKHDIGEVKWYLHYDTVQIAIRHHRWYLVVKGRCIYLDENNLCKIYDRRPNKCRVHQPPECERYGKWYDRIFDTPEELEAFLDREKRRRQSKGRKAKGNGRKSKGRPKKRK